MKWLVLQFSVRTTWAYDEKCSILFSYFWSACSNLILGQLAHILQAQWLWIIEKWLQKHKVHFQMTFSLLKLPIRYDEGVTVKILLSFYGGNFTLWTGWICSLFQTLSAARHIQTAEKVLYDNTSINCLCAFAHPNAFCRSEVRQLGMGAMFTQEYIVCCKNQRNKQQALNESIASCKPAYEQQQREQEWLKFAIQMWKTVELYAFLECVWFLYLDRFADTAANLISTVSKDIMGCSGGKF